MENFRSGKAILRSPRLTDLPQLLFIENRCFRYQRFGENDFITHIKSKTSIFAVGVLGGQVVGYIAGRVSRKSTNRQAEIYSMAVLRTARRSGVASAFLKYFEKVALLEDCQAIILEVRKTNYAARSLYRTFDYKVEAELPDYYARGSDGVKMRKLLTSKERN